MGKPSRWKHLKSFKLWLYATMNLSILFSHFYPELGRRTRGISNEENFIQFWIVMAHNYLWIMPVWADPPKLRATHLQVIGNFEKIQFSLKPGRPSLYGVLNKVSIKFVNNKDLQVSSDAHTVRKYKVLQIKNW